MSTKITIALGGNPLLDQARNQQNASRQAQLEKEATQRLETQATSERTKALAAQGKDANGNPLTGTSSRAPQIERRPAANRTLASGSVAGVSYTTDLNTSTNTFSITVGPPGLLQSATVTGIKGNHYPSPQTLPASTSTGEQDLPAVGLLGQSKTTNKWVWDLDWPSNALGYGVRTVDNAPPDELTTSYSFGVSASIGFTQDKQLLLPLGKNSCLFIYVRNWFKQFSVYNRVNTDVYSTAEVLNVPDDNLYINKSYRSRLQNSTVEDVLDHKELYSDYSIYAFIVSPTTARRVEVPAALEANIRALYPPVLPNSTAEFDQSASRELLRAAFLGGNAYTTPWVITKGERDSYDFNKWAATTRYGDYPTFAGADALPRHFGLLFPRLNNSYFTPAIYRFVKGPMVIDESSVNYAYMRSTYFPLAPRFYLGECRVESVVNGETTNPSCSTLKVGFDVTRTQPETLSTEIPASNFQPDAKYDVALNGASRGSILYAWDWGRRSYCRQEAASLGFTSADLTP